MLKRIPSLDIIDIDTGIGCSVSGWPNAISSQTIAESRTSFGLKKSHRLHRFHTGNLEVDGLHRLAISRQNAAFIALINRIFSFCQCYSGWAITKFVGETVVPTVLSGITWAIAPSVRPNPRMNVSPIAFISNVWQINTVTLMFPELGSDRTGRDFAGIYGVSIEKLDFRFMELLV